MTPRSLQSNLTYFNDEKIQFLSLGNHQSIPSWIRYLREYPYRHKKEVVCERIGHPLRDGGRRQEEEKTFYTWPSKNSCLVHESGPIHQYLTWNDHRSQIWPHKTPITFWDSTPPHPDVLFVFVFVFHRKKKLRPKGVYDRLGRIVIHLFASNYLINTSKVTFLLQTEVKESWKKTPLLSTTWTTILVSRSGDKQTFRPKVCLEGLLHTPRRSVTIWSLVPSWKGGVWTVGSWTGVRDNELF